jgi:hypothetical protein
MDGKQENQMSNQQDNCPYLSAGPFKIFADETAEQWFLVQSPKSGLPCLIGLSRAQFEELERDYDRRFKEGFVPSADMYSMYHLEALAALFAREQTREDAVVLAGASLAHCRWVAAGGARIELDGLAPDVGLPGIDHMLKVAIKPGETVLADVLRHVRPGWENGHLLQQLLTDGIRLQREKRIETGDYGAKELAVLVRERDGVVQAELTMAYGKLLETVTKFPVLLEADPRESCDTLLGQMLGHAFCGFVEARDGASAVLRNSRQRLEEATSMLLCYLNATTWAIGHTSSGPYEIEVWQDAGKWNWAAPDSA